MKHNLTNINQAKSITNNPINQFILPLLMGSIHVHYTKLNTPVVSCAMICYSRPSSTIQVLEKEIVLVVLVS